ncbi:hypothetical protein [Corynebacterium callunae]|uniref:hypothetical protein n=1 Tax=Corynebacterium callunae TaxID=1721 RepID=UPI000A7ACC12|nr:hypothetical protein [Corynebacterium callunae]
MPVENLSGNPQLRAKAATLISGCLIEAIVNLTLAAVILNGRPPLRPQALADSRRSSCLPDARSSYK